MKSMGLFRAAFFALMAAAVVGPSRTAFADKEGSTYRGKVRCSDKNMAEAFKRYFECRYLFILHPSTLPVIPGMKSPACLSAATQWDGEEEDLTTGRMTGSVKPMTGKLWAGSPSAWFATRPRWDARTDNADGFSGQARLAPRNADGSVAMGTRPTPFLIVTKAGDANVAINALVCSYERAPRIDGVEVRYDTQGPPIFVKESNGRIAHDAPKGTKLSLPVSNNTQSRNTVYFVYLESESKVHTIDFKLELPWVKRAPTSTWATTPNTTD